MQKLPTFLGIGAQKSGTTWLHQTLSQHQDIFLPKEKELMFFDEQRNWSKGVSWYASNFEEANERQLMGEITPGYLWTSSLNELQKEKQRFRTEIPKRAQEVLGKDLKLIALLRNPVDRTISAYMHHLKKERISIEDVTWDSIQELNVIDMGLYSVGLKNWFRYFDERCFHVRTFETMNKDKKLYLDSVLAFLGLAQFLAPPSDARAQYKFDYKRDESGVQVEIDGNISHPFTIDDINRIRDYFRKDVEKLREISPEFVQGWERDFEA